MQLKKIFISYASEQHQVAEQLYHALIVCDHAVFFDRDSIPAGDEFHRRIQEEIRSSDVFIFLVSPASVQVGSYARTELKFAQDAWSNPRGHVLPVFAETTPIEAIPAYLSSISILQPEGNLIAEIVAGVNDLTSGWNPAFSVTHQAYMLQAMQQRLDLAALQQELAAFDAAWDKKKVEYYITTKDGAKVPPPESDDVIFILIISIVSLFLMIHLLKEEPILIAISIIAILAGIYTINKAKTYEREQAQYQAKRNLIVQKIENMERQLSTPAQGQAT